MEYERDSSGRLKYHPDLHPNHGKPFTKEDKEYIIEWYEIIGTEELAFALGRTEATIQQKVAIFRKRGMMPQSTYKKGQNKHFRTLGLKGSATNQNTYLGG